MTTYVYGERFLHSRRYTADVLFLFHYFINVFFSSACIRREEME